MSGDELSDTHNNDRQAEPSLTQMLQALLADREEERRWERERHEQELAQRKEEQKIQLDLINALMEGASQAPPPRQSLPDIAFRRLTESDDIEAYLTTFKRLVTSANLERQHWAVKLAPYLTGKAQQAYAALSSDDASNYTKLKEAIFHRYNITVESYRQQFRATSKKPGESYQELVMRLGHLASKWLKDCTMVKAIQDQVILEQLLNTLPKDMGIFVRERKPKSSLEASMLGDDYLQARKGIPSGPQNTFKRGSLLKCFACGKFGHIKKDCQQDPDKLPSTTKDTDKPKRDFKDIKCFNC